MGDCLPFIDSEIQYPYFIAIRKISFLDSFLSGGCVGTSFRNSAKAPDTFCWRHRSLELVKIFRTIWPFLLVVYDIGLSDELFGNDLDAIEIYLLIKYALIGSLVREIC